MDPVVVLGDVTWELAVVCLGAFALGALGGALHNGAPPGGAPATVEGAVPVVASRKRRALIGGVAAVAVLYLTNPATPVALIGGSFAAGYAGQSILTALESRAIAALAQADAAQKSRDVKDALAASDVLTSGSRGAPTADAEARLNEAQSTLSRLRVKYATKG